MNGPGRDNFCVVIPAYNEGKRIAGVVRGVRGHCPNVVVVDDGSADSTASEAESAGAHVVRHDRNRGKGVALESGFRHAAEQKYDFVVTMDADGQHDPDDLPGLVDAHVTSGKPVIIGSRMANPGDMPLKRRLTNRFMSSLLSREMGQDVPDTQSGFRLYRTDILGLLATESSGYAAESECLLRLADHGVQIGSAPIKVIYGDEVSKISPFKDAVRFFLMLKKWRGRDRAAGGGPGEGRL